MTTPVLVLFVCLAMAVYHVNAAPNPLRPLHEQVVPIKVQNASPGCVPRRSVRSVELPSTASVAVIGNKRSRAEHDEDERERRRRRLDQQPPDAEWPEPLDLAVIASTEPVPDEVHEQASDDAVAVQPDYDRSWEDDVLNNEDYDSRNG